MWCYFKSLGAFFFAGVLGFGLLTYIVTQRIVTVYRTSGIFTEAGWESQYYLYGINLTVYAAEILFIVGAILTGIVAFICRRMNEIQFPVRFGWIGGGILGVLWFILTFGFELLLIP
jgi:hypothetical protein